MSLSVGDIVEGTVTGITKFGAFVELPDGRTGLVHISEVADTYVENVQDYVQVNDKVNVKILSFADDGKKIGLSIRQALSDEERQAALEEAKARRGGAAGKARRAQSFEEMLQKFKKESERKQSDLRKSVSKRNRGRGY